MKNFPTALQVVAVALIDDAGRVLMQRRPAHKQHGGLWEFPGGKVEGGETLTFALVREIAEELALELDESALAYLDRAADGEGGVVITLYTCREWRGDPVCLDAETIAWVTACDLLQLEMPPLDVPLARAVKEVIERAK